MTDLASKNDTELRGKLESEIISHDVISEAKRATEVEHNMSLRQALKTYPHAVGWSILFSTALVMEGYDNALIATLFAYAPFQSTFGTEQPDGSYQITSAWQSGLTNGCLVGQILGLFITGMVVERLGYRKSIIGAMLACIAFIFIIFFANSLQVLLVGEVLIGIPWGVFQTTTTTYASEVCPVVLRPYLTTYVNLCWVMGQFIAAGLLKGMQGRSDEWGYKIPFAIQWIWPVPIIIGVALAPESPWWLIRKERPEEARKALQRLTVPERDPDFNIDDAIAMIRGTNELEKKIGAGTSYADCFHGVDLRRTEIVCLTWATQALCGSTLMGYSTYFFQQAGLATSNAFTMSMVQYIIGAFGTILSWPMMSRFGRRTLYITGLASMGVVLFTIGCLGIISKTSVPAQWGVGALLLLYTLCYDLTVGPICYSLVAELSSTRLRSKTIVLARNIFTVSGLITNTLIPRMLNPSAWNWGAKIGYFWAGSCLICFLWAFFRLPEPKGRTYAELDLLFEQRVSARKFKSTYVDPFNEAHGDVFEEKKAEGTVVENIERI